MDPSIRPVAPGPHPPYAVLRRQGSQPFDLERELARRGGERESEDSQAEDPEREPTPVAPPADDEAGSHLDLTA